MKKSILFAVLLAFASIASAKVACTTDIQCEKQAAKRIVALEKQIPKAEIAVNKAKEALQKKEKKLFDLNQELSILKDDTKQ